MTTLGRAIDDEYRHMHLNSHKTPSSVSIPYEKLLIDGICIDTEGMICEDEYGDEYVCAIYNDLVTEIHE